LAVVRLAVVAVSVVMVTLRIVPSATPANPNFASVPVLAEAIIVRG